MNTEIYFDTLSATLEAFRAQTEKKGGKFVACVTDETIAEKFTGGVGYEQTISASFALQTYKGRNTGKYASLSIYRMPSGRYELTAYIL